MYQIDDNIPLPKSKSGCRSAITEITRQFLTTLQIGQSFFVPKADIVKDGKDGAAKSTYAIQNRLRHRFNSAIHRLNMRLSYRNIYSADGELMGVRVWYVGQKSTDKGA